jgi:transposase
MPVVTDEELPRQRRRGRDPKQFRKDAAALVIDQHRSIAEVARELGVVEQTLGNWGHLVRVAGLHRPGDQ